MCLTSSLAALLDHGDTVPEVEEIAGSQEDDIVWVTPDVRVRVPSWLRQAREAAGLTQGELATRLGVTYQAIQKWERPGANPTLSTLQRVARALDRPLTLRLP